MIIDGFINLNKNVDISSAHMVGKVKRLIHVGKIGHMGTLDPMAEGVLLIAIGKACKSFDSMLKKQKTYVSIFRFGTETDTLDREGSITQTSQILPKKEDILQIIPQLCGKIEQKSPNFSAKKIGGRKAYELARKNIEFEAPTKMVEIFSIKLLEQISDTDFKFEILCGGGTYIRAIARDMAKLLGTVAFMQDLVRTKVGDFELKDAITFDELQKKYENNEEFIIPLQNPQS